MPAQFYLDYQSSKPVDPRVVDAMRPWFTERFGNPSSLHLDGDEATTPSRGPVKGLHSS